MDNYNKNKLLDRQIHKIGSDNLYFYIGFTFLYSPTSKLFKKQFLHYLKKLAHETGQRFEYSLVLQKTYASYIQKRKDPRLVPNNNIPKRVTMERVNIKELIDISLGGIKIKTDTRVRYGDKFFVYLEFDHHELYIQVTPAFIRPVEVINE